MEEEGGDLIANQRPETICVDTVTGGSTGIMPAGTAVASKINTFVAEVMLSGGQRGGALLFGGTGSSYCRLSGTVKELDVVGRKKELL